MKVPTELSESNRIGDGEGETLTFVTSSRYQGQKSIVESCVNQY